jgi:hypothetical protein
VRKYIIKEYIQATGEVKFNQPHGSATISPNDYPSQFIRQQHMDGAKHPSLLRRGSPHAPCLKEKAPRGECGDRVQGELGVKGDAGTPELTPVTPFERDGTAAVEEPFSETRSYSEVMIFWLKIEERATLKVRKDPCLPESGERRNDKFSA